jgi:tetratricopeptide (TPR) repeat protein
MTRRTLAIATLLGAIVYIGGCGPSAELTPQQKLERGWEAMRAANVSTARLMFEDALVTSKPDPATHAYALYSMAAALALPQVSPDVDRAVKLLDEAIQIDPADNTKPWAMLMKARLPDLRDVGVDDLEKLVEPKARPLYREVIEKYPDHLAGDEATAYLITSLVVERDTASLEEAVKLANRLTSRRPDSPWASYVMQMKSSALRVLGRYEERLQVEQDALALAEKNNKVGTTQFIGMYWNIGIIAEFEVGDFEIARKFYNRIITEYPTEQRVFSAKYALKRLDRVEAELRAEIAKERGAQ